MFQDQDGEREILLGNKQLLGIFFVLAVLFAVFFTAGYMVGRNGVEKKPAATSANATSSPPAAADDSAGMGETHAVPPEGSTSGAAEPRTVSDSKAAGAYETTSRSAGAESGDTDRESSSSARRKRARETEALTTRTETPSRSPFVPQPGQTYLQVAAVSRPEAETVAGVLSKRGFHAHVAPKPGTKWFRVLVGPVHDAGELSTTRDALMKKGFREVFVQRY
jgi:cell division protein FtsN